MRQSNQNKRMRGRSRKASNPLSRTYESNGPDVKIRGTALHVAEKYVQLARDSQASGDRITAENYLQHAEHYFRIIAAAQGASALPSRDDDRYHEGSPGNGANGNSGDRSQGPIIAADAPQPYVDAMPGVDNKGANGSSRRNRRPVEAEDADDEDVEVSAQADESSAGAGSDGADEAGSDDAGADGDDSPSKPKRRARGSRGRGSRTKAASGDGEDGTSDGDAAGMADAATDEPAEAKKPARRTRRPAKKDAAEGGEASEEVMASDA